MFFLGPVKLSEGEKSPVIMLPPWGLKCIHFFLQKDKEEYGDWLFNQFPVHAPNCNYIIYTHFIKLPWWLITH